MDGKFKGWVSGKMFGFIVPSDGSQDVFVHKNAPGANAINPGDLIDFDTEDKGKGKSATNIRVVSTSPVEKRTATLKFWNDRGFGFAALNDGSDLFIHYSALRPDHNGYLSEGDILECEVVEGTKGTEARNVVVTGWRRPGDGLAAFADMGGPGWLNSLADLAEDEPWEFRHTHASEPFPILRSYIRHTFRRLEETNGIGISSDEAYASFNTGLVTENQEEIYAFFVKNPVEGRQRWKLSAFKKASDRAMVDKFGSSPPPLANYFEDPSVLLYDRRCELFISIDHVMENIERFPKHLQNQPYVARQLLISAEATTKKRVYRNYKTAIPQFFRDRGRAEGAVQLLLPICLENPAKADLALVIERNEDGTAYRGSTVLTLDMAYNNARLLARPDSEWLEP